MNDNLPKKYGNNVFSKFFRFLKNLLYVKSNTTTVQTIEKHDIHSIKEVSKNNEFTNRVKTDINYDNSEEKKRELMEKLKDNPELLKELSVSILEKVLKYYQEENERKKEILKKLIA